MRRIPVLLPLLAAALPGHAAPLRYPITPAAVAAALAAQAPAFATTAASIEVPPVTASGPAPQLVVEGSPVIDRERTEVRLGCASTAECLPFLVTLRGASATARPGPASPAGAASLLQPPVLRSGAHALLRIDSGRLHITLTVIALSSGGVGDRIRVVSEDRRVHFEARILSPGILEGSL